jgi:Fe-S-cluster-containing hydrogenase component 2
MSIEEQLSNLPEDALKKQILKLILKDVDTSDETYQESFKETYKVNLDVCGTRGYQIYEPNKYTSKKGEHLEDADVTIRFRKMDYVRQLIRGEKVGTEMGRDSINVLHINRKEPLISTRTRTNEGNAEVLISKIPFLDPVVRNFGTSRQARPLHDEPEPLGPVEEGEIESLMKRMLSESVDVSDELYKKNLQGQVLKVNWDIDGKIAYQIFEETKYNYEFGKHIEDTDLTLVFNNPEHAKRFLLETPSNYAPILDEDDNLIVTIKIPVISIHFKDPDEPFYSLTRLPFLRNLMQPSAPQSPTEENKEDERENYGHYIPVDLPMGDFENEVVPYKVFEHFINKASNIVVRTCPCRERWDCQDHSKEYGCIFMGDDTKNMVISPDEGYIATKEQALEHVRNAIAEGLVPTIGRNVAEAEDGHGVKDTGRFLSGCFCCDCCCIAVKTSHYATRSSMGGDGLGESKGWKIKVDPEKCDACRTCVEACAFKLRYIEDGKSSVDNSYCAGCGRCVKVCPKGAISIEIEDPDYIENYITKIESIVDVTDQTIKT